MASNYAVCVSAIKIVLTSIVQIKECQITSRLLEVSKVTVYIYVVQVITVFPRHLTVTLSGTCRNFGWGNDILMGLIYCTVCMCGKSHLVINSHH